MNIGVAAHITAASPGGPRFDPSLTPDERHSADNGIWLCQNCAKLADNDSRRYAIETLRDWKRRAEESALAEVEGRAQPQPVDLSAELELSYAKERIQSERHDYRLQVMLRNRGTEPLGPYHIDVEMPARVVHLPHQQSLYVPDRSSQDVAFLRVASNSHNEEVYPGDTKVVMSVHYFMDHDIYYYFNRGELFRRPVTATLYRPGVRPITIERPFGELQIF